MKRGHIPFSKVPARGRSFQGGGIRLGRMSRLILRSAGLMVGLLRGATDKKAGKKLRRKLAALAFAMALSVVIPGFVNTGEGGHLYGNLSLALSEMSQA